MSDFAIPGVDSKYCKITQGSKVILFPLVTETVAPIPIIAENVRPGFDKQPVTSQSQQNTAIRTLNSIASFTDKINDKTKSYGTPRGTTFAKIGEKGFKFEIDGKLLVPYAAARNKLLAIINSGQPCKLYLSRFQTISTSGKISDINPSLRARDGFYVVLQAGSTVTEDSNDLSGCKVKIIALEAKYTEKIEVGILDDYLGPLLDIVENTATAIDTAKVFLQQINGYLIQTLGLISNIGSEINTIIGEVNAISNSIENLLKTPSLLRKQYQSITGNIVNLVNKIVGNKNRVTQDGLNKQKSLYRFSRSLARYEPATPPSNSTVSVNNANLVNVDAIKENIINGKLANFQRYSGFGLMLAVVQNSVYSSLEEVDNVMDDLKDTYAFMAGDTSYNGIIAEQAISPSLTEDTRDHDILGIFYSSMHATLNNLRNIKQNLANQSFTTPCDTNIWNVISQYYTGAIENGRSLKDIAELLYFANNLSSYNDIIAANTKVLLPIL